MDRLPVVNTKKDLPWENPYWKNPTLASPTQAKLKEGDRYIVAEEGLIYKYDQKKWIVVEPETLNERLQCFDAKNFYYYPEKGGGCWS